jgi:hypothetical protein
MKYGDLLEDETKSRIHCWKRKNWWINDAYWLVMP